MRMSIALFALLFVFACGSAGSNPGGGDDDDTPPTDAPENPTTDAPPGTVSALGTTCTPDANNPQGTCPAGFECLNLTGATNPWCSKTCQTAADTCAADYTGPGKAACILTVTPSGGGAAVNYCSVICEDLTGNNGICAAGQCNGTCPGSMTCTGPITNNNPPPDVIGNACE